MLIAAGGGRPITMTETRTDSSEVRIADASCANGASDREAGLVPLLYRVHHAVVKRRRELVVTSARSSVLRRTAFRVVGEHQSRQPKRVSSETQ